MMKKKLLSLFLCLLLACGAVSALAGCNKKDERTELRIISWNFGNERQNNLNRRMIKAFEEKHPDYRVTIESIGTTYTETIQNLASQQKLPDVFMLDNLPTALVNSQLLELTEMTKNDPDWAKIPSAVMDATAFNGHTFAIPAEMHMWGVFVNDTVFETQNLDTLPIGCSLADFKEAVNDLNRPNDKIASLNTELEMINWLPVAESDGALGYYTWDGEKYNLDSQAFSDTLSYMQGLRRDRKTFDAWTPEMREATGRESTDDLWFNNQLAMYFSTTDTRSARLYGEEKEMQFKGKMRFLGVPGGRQVIIPDIWGVSKATKYPEMAYELAKWMSFSPEGILKRLELDKAGINAGGKQEFVSLPLTNEEEVVDAYFDNETISGLRQVFKMLDNGVVEGVKIIPGYRDCRWTYPTGMSYEFTDSVSGEKSTRTNATLEMVYDDIWKSQAELQWANIKVDLNQKINQAYQNSSKALNRMYPKA